MLSMTNMTSSFATDNMSNTAPRFCTCISYRFLTILWSVFSCQKNVTFTCLPGIMLMNLQKHVKKLMKHDGESLLTDSKTNVSSFISKRSCSLRSRRVRKIGAEGAKRLFKAIAIMKKVVSLRSKGSGLLNFPAGFFPRTPISSTPTPPLRAACTATVLY